MSALLARLARTLTQHWKRGLAGAIVVVVLLGAAAGAGGEAADDFSIPGTESQQAIDLFKAHSPRSRAPTRRWSSRSRRAGSPMPVRARAVEDALARVERLPGVDQVADPFARGGAVSPDGTLASVDVRYRLEPADLEKSDGEALLAAAETAERDGVDVAARGILIDLASEQEAPVGELIGVAIAILLLTLLFRSLAAMAATLAGALIGVDRRADPAGGAGAAARPAVVRDGDRGHARPRRGDRLLAADHRPLPRAGRGRRQRARRVGQGRRDVGRVGRRGRA